VQNMWPFCTRLSLFDRWGEICRDYEGGKRCIACMQNVVSTEAAKWRDRLPVALWKSARIHGALKGLYQAALAHSASQESASQESDGCAEVSDRHCREHGERAGLKPAPHMGLFVKRALLRPGLGVSVVERRRAEPCVAERAAAFARSRDWLP
jgi:hypothetical protein